MFQSQEIIHALIGQLKTTLVDDLCLLRAIGGHYRKYLKDKGEFWSAIAV